MSIESLTPLTREELFLEKIIGGDIETPTPKQRIELFLAKIAGEDVELPVPATRIELFLAKIAGEDVILPEPATREELFLGNIAGMDIELPEPKTREEWYLYKWAEGGNAILKTVTGTLLHITDALAKPAKKFTATLEPIQSGSGDPSPENIRPITGHTGANVVRTGKNLLEPKFYDGIIYNPSVGQAAFTTLTDVTNTVTKDGNTYSKTGSAWNIIMNMVLPLNESFVGKTLKFSGTINAIPGYRCAWYIADAEHITKRKSSLMNELPTWSITIQEGDAYLIWFMNCSLAGTFVLTEPMIELSSIATPYEPYTGTTIPITFPDAAGTVYGGTLTFVDGGWKLKVTHKGIVLDGTETWNTGVYGNGFRYYTSQRYTDAKNNQICKTSITQDKETVNTVWISIDTAVSSNQIDLRGYSSVTTLNTKEKWLAYLASNNVTLVYELATPIEYTLSESQALTLLKGTNNIWVDDSNDLELTYLAEE